MACSRWRSRCWRWTFPWTATRELLPQFADLWPAVVAYLISFFTIGIIWVNHHRVLNDVQVVTRSLLFINLILLAVTVAIPFATSTLADYLTDGGQSGHLAAALYAGVFELMSLSFLPLYEWVLRHDDCVRYPMPAAAKNPARLRFYAGQIPYLIAVGRGVPERSGRGGHHRRGRRLLRVRARGAPAACPIAAVGAVRGVRGGVRRGGRPGRPAGW